MGAAIAIWRSSDAGFGAEFARLEQRRHGERARVEEVVAQIVDDVRRRGDAALLEATERFDRYALRAGELALTRDEIEQGARLDPADEQALRTAAERVRAYHAEHVATSWTVEREGEQLGQLIRPLERVGLYVPGGVAPLASTVVMLAVPARVAGVPELAMCSPGRILHPAVLCAARLAGVERIYRVGGAQAVAALAYGTESVARVDKIAGPGNAYVQEAKRQVFGQVAIDAEAGPSEVFIVADATAPPDYLAADLLAQAEHPMPSVALATPDARLAGAVAEELTRQLAELPDSARAREALARRGALLVVRDLEEALELANRYAPEHLQLMVAEPRRWLERVRCAGAVFLGPQSPVPIGDYVAGPSHVLPTGGTARFFSPLGVEDFQKRTSVVELSPAALRRVGPAAVRLARLEGLEAHARAVEARLEDPAGQRQLDSARPRRGP